MKKLHDGTLVSKDTPTKNIGGLRYLFSQEELDTRNELQARIDAEKARYIAEDKYKDDRRKAFAKLDGEGMDAMRKALEALYAVSSAVPPTEYQEYMDKVAEIKEAHPKTIT